MDWSNVLETFIGAALAFVFAWILQRQLIKRTEDFQKDIQNRMEEFQSRSEGRRMEFDRKEAMEQRNFESRQSTRRP